MSQNQAETFFENIQPVTHNLNLCLNVELEITGQIKKVSLYDRQKKVLSVDLDSFALIKAYIETQISMKITDTYFISTLKYFILSIGQKLSKQTMPIDSIKLVLIYDLSDLDCLKLNTWTSFPALPGSEAQVQDYFNGVNQFSRIALTKKEQQELDKLITKILEKTIPKYNNY